MPARSLDRAAANLAATERRLRRRARIAELVRIAMLVLFVLFVWTQSYVGREKVVENARAGCERSKLDRTANANGWRIAEAARRADGQVAVARRYARIAGDLERRSRVDCQDAYPGASVFGFN